MSYAIFMRSLLVCLPVCAVLPASGVAAAAPEGRLDRSMIVQAMSAVADWQIEHPSRFPTYAWHVAPFWAGLMAFAPLSPHEERYLNAVRANGVVNNWQLGPRPFHADDAAIAQSYFMLYERDSNPAYIQPALAYLDRMLANSYQEDLSFSMGKTEREWAWCDALFMAPPVLAMAFRHTGDTRYTALMERLWWKTTDFLYDTQEKLYYRDSRYFEPREPNGEKVFWSRGNGWVFAGIARVLDYLPADAPQAPRLRKLFQDMAERIAGLQSEDGYWRASLLDPASVPMPESSGTGFFTYAFAWGINHGLLDRGRFEPVVRKGWEALLKAVQPDGMLGYVQQVGHKPGDTGPDQTEAYGPGAFLLAGVEVYQLAE